MSAGELSACIQGGLLVGGCGKMIPPDNRCCFCLTLRLGVIIIGILNFALYLLLFSWYISNIGLSSNFTDSAVSNMDISVFVIFCVQMMVNLLLVVGAVKRIPHHTFPWLCSNAVIIAILMVMIFMLVFFGASRNSLSYQEYVSSLSILSLLAGTDMFCCIVIFQFRRNLIIEATLEREDSVTHGRPTAPSSSPPPAYEVAAPGHPPVKVPLEEPPPEYEAAMAMLAPEETGPTGPQLRKKSLTNHEV